MSIRRQIREKNTVKNYRLYLIKFGEWAGDRELENISPDEVLAYLTEKTEGQKQSTKRFRYTLLKTFFNFIKNTIDPSLT
ncbi:MAG: site-specific integrase, partial [Deltaproteobacteria bacterium]|nr:site-specific integrase [Deltaproteobacteria bacterium]